MFKLDVINAVALNTFRETVRDRVLYAIFFFALLASIAGAIFGSLSVHQEVRILLDLGLLTITIFGAVIAVFVGANLVFKEIDKKTIYLIFSKPIARGEFILGKFLGLALCLLVIIFAMGAFLYFVACVQTGAFGPVYPLAGALSLVYLELVLLVAMATCFSTFATPLASTFFALALWICGHLGLSLLNLGQLSESPVVRAATKGVYYVLPDLASLTMIRSEMIDARFVSPTVILTAVAYVFVYSILLLSLASIIAERREFQ
ncbi:MAG: ABC transporter permease [Candidatus Obscuribacterales bacterium]|nr:ABC transporter permease [Candidatus Obscuribacterales bacterium]